MKNVTNRINQIGKEIHDKEFTIKMSLSELEEIKYATDYLIEDGYDGSVLVGMSEDVTKIIDRIKGK